jgi:hypothetical protein
MPLGSPRGCLALLALLAPAPCAARVGVVAPLGALGIAPDEAAKVQRWLETAFSELGGHRWLGSSRLARLLKRGGQRMGVDCESHAPCLAAAARAAGAELAIAGEVGSLGGGYMIYLRLVDAAGKQLASVSGTIDPRRGQREGAHAIACQLLAPRRYVGALLVAVDVPNAWIYVDGKRVARSAARAIGGLAPGPHALRVTHEAYREFVRFVAVEFERTVRVDVKLSAFPVRAEEMKLSLADESRPLADRELPWYRRWWALSAFGAVLLAGAATTVGILARRSVSRDSEAVVRYTAAP